MSLTEKEKHTQVNYDLKAKEWLAVSGGEKRPPFWPKEMELFVQMISGDTVLDLGSGPGTDSTRLTEYGLKVVSLDYSITMLNVALDLDPKLSLVQGDIYNIPIPEHSVSGVWACASILHLENTDNALQEIYRVLTIDGVAFISVKEGDGEKVDERTGYFFKYFQDETFKNLLNQNGFNVLSAERRSGTPNHDWLTYHVCKSNFLLPKQP